MLTEMRTSLNRLFETSKYEASWSSWESLTYLTCLEIESNYLMLVTTPKNMEVIKVMRESFAQELTILDETPEQRHRQRIYLQDLIIDELNKEEPNVENVIQTLSEYAIIIKKDAGFKEYLDTLQVGVLLADAKMPKMYKVQITNDKSPNVRVERIAQFKKLINRLNDIQVSRIYLGGKELTVFGEQPIDMELEEIQTLINIVGQEVDKPARQVMNRKRKIMRELVDSDKFFNGLPFYYYGWTGTAQVKIIDDWYFELKRKKPDVIETKNTEGMKFVLSHTTDPKQCDKIFFNPKFEMTYEEFTKRIFSLIEIETEGQVV